jgi:hypothetical protein
LRSWTCRNCRRPTHWETIPVFEHGATYGKIWDDIRKYMENRWAWENIADLRKINRWKYVDMMDFTENHVVDFTSKHRFYLGMYQQTWVTLW